MAFRCSGFLSVPCLSPSCVSFPTHFPVLRYSAFCLFPFVLPGFAPTAVPPVLTFCFRFRSFPLCFRFLSSASALDSNYSAFCFSFPFLPVLASQRLPRCPPSAFASSISSSLPPDFPCFRSDFKYSAFCLFPFVPPGFAPTAVPPVPAFRFRLRLRPFSVRIAFFRPRSFPSDYSAFRFYFSLHPASPNGGSVRANLSAFRSPVSMLTSGFGTQHAASSILRQLLRHTAATPVPCHLPFGS